LRDKLVYFKVPVCSEVDIFYCKSNKLKVAKNVDGDFVVDVVVVPFYLKLKHNIFVLIFNDLSYLCLSLQLIKTRKHARAIESLQTCILTVTT